MVLNLISGPRNVSTALMYSFAQRSDTKVVDEPFYAYYLIKSGVVHPGWEETVESMPVRFAEVLEGIKGRAKGSEVLFVKNMAHHLIAMDISFLFQYTNIFLIRDPQELITSFTKVISNPTMNDVGLQRSWQLFEMLKKEQGKAPIVLDSNEILKHPKKVLTGLCGLLGLPFQEKMLEWEPRPIKEDGVWAKYWYGELHTSTGFRKPRGSKAQLPQKYKSLYNEAMPYYERLYEYALKA